MAARVAAVAGMPMSVSSIARVRIAGPRAIVPARVDVGTTASLGSSTRGERSGREGAVRLASLASPSSSRARLRVVPVVPRAAADNAPTGEDAAAAGDAKDGDDASGPDVQPWFRFLTRTTIIAAGLVVFGSMAAPWPAGGQVPFMTILMKRLGAIWVARQLAKAILKPLVIWAHRLGRLLAPAAATIGRACVNAKAKYDANPKGIILIPFVAAFVGWFTNWLAVKMIFYPIGFLGLPFLKQAVEGEMYGFDILNPLALGWQGIVPAKAARMSYDMVSMVTDKLIDVQEVFMKLDPRRISELLAPEVPEMARRVAKDMTKDVPMGPWAVDLGERALPQSCGPLVDGIKDAIVRYLAGFVRTLQEQVDRVVDLKELVVTAMCEDKRVIVELFQRCGREELKFLTNSGLWFGFLLGCIQALFWLFYDNPWTLTIGGTIVGLLTNWIALKCIFEPVEPVYLFDGKLKIQGLFLQRQLEVSGEFSDHLATKVLTSEMVWDNMLKNRKGPEFEAMLDEFTRDFVRNEAESQGRGLLAGGVEETALLEEVVSKVKERLIDHVHVLHEYTDDTLGLKELMREKMALMTPQEFERVLHPIFEQDELTLIISGAVLGAIAGFIQQVYTIATDDGSVGPEKKEGGGASPAR